MTSSSRTDEEIARYRWLMSEDGGAVLAAVAAETAAGTPALRLAERLRERFPPDLVALAMTQHDLRTRAAAKFGHADRMVFTREGLEQATSDVIARHRARRYAGCASIVDLCCGIGGDLMALAALPGVARLTAVDRDPIHLLLAAANAAIVRPGLEVTTIDADVRDVGLAEVDAVFIDPARRSTQGRLGGVASEPPLSWAIRLAERVARVGIKSAPGIPHDLVPPDWELETIALGTDLKEAVLWSPALAAGNRTATVIDGADVHQLRAVPGEAPGLRAPEAGDSLLDPNPAVTRAGLVEDLARALGAAKIDDEIGFLVTREPVATPFARGLRVLASLPWHEKRVRAVLRELDAGPVDVRRRGLAGDVDAITKRLRGTGSRRLTVAMTRVTGAPWAILCEDGPGAHSTSMGR
ncbi:MAG TPA: class I SAM-dependent methyltransferase [Thermomicrobiales bacterium]|nr:class I SAM-dependent methyltransferase [Thermomicrobiales bacterium]